MATPKQFWSIVLVIVLIGSVFGIDNLIGKMRLADSMDSAALEAQLEVEEAQHEASRKRQAISLFPNAKTVRLFVHEDGIGIGPKTNTADFLPKGGAKLTIAEIGVLGRSFMWSTPPMSVAACCVPRHAFAFYDSANRFLGSISVCFECSCAQSNGLTAPPDMTWIEWDRAKLAEIVVAHGLKTEF
jgi:hypothetical protein